MDRLAHDKGPGQPAIEKLDIASLVPPALRDLAAAISNSPLLGDPDPATISAVEVARAQSLGDNGGLDPKSLDALAAKFAGRLPPSREVAIVKLFGPPRIDASGELRRDTRIVCTIGPKCNSAAILSDMIRAGMDVARLNFSHIAILEEAKILVDNLREAMKSSGRRIEVFGDLPGPKIRIGAIESPIEASEGALLRLGGGEIPLTPECIARDLKIGDRLYVDDGKIQLRVESKDADGALAARVEIGGLIKPRKGINLPDTIISERVPTARDMEKLAMMKSLGITRVAGSFIETAADVGNIRRAYESLVVTPIYPSDGEVQIISKIERPQALENAREVYDVSDGIMIARGDFGVELGDANVPLAQQQLHNLAGETAKPCGTATQMLSSLQTGDRPLRAEVADIAYAVMQGTSFVMTSEETAMSDNPVNTVKWMDHIVATVERALRRGEAHSIARF